MKTIFFHLCLLMLTAGTLNATTIKGIVNNGYWKTASSWNLNRVPANYDTISIEAGKIIKVKGTINLTNVVIIVYGTLLINEGDLKLSINSKILVYEGGLIKGQSSGIIEIGGVKKFDYSNPQVVGPAFADRFTSGEPNGFVLSSLPVKFLEFKANKTGQSVQLFWATSEEINNSHFDVQRSEDGQNWKTIAMVFAVSNPGLVNKYQYSDQYASNHKVFYRLKQVDSDGKSAYSSIKTVNGNEQASSSHIYVSSKQTIAIEFNEQVKGKVVVRLFNINGQGVREQLFTQVNNRIEVYVPNALPGVYAVQVQSGENLREVKKVIL